MAAPLLPRSRRHSRALPGRRPRSGRVPALAASALALVGLLGLLAALGASSKGFAGFAGFAGPAAPAPKAASGARGGGLSTRHSSNDAKSGLQVPEASSGVLMLNIVTMLFGSNQVLIKTLETDDATAGAMDCALCMSLRFGIATLALAGAVLASRATAPAAAVAPEGLAPPGRTAAAAAPKENDSTLWQGSLELSVWLFLGFLAQAVGLQYTTASAGALLGSLTVVVVPLLALTDGRKVADCTWLSVGLALLGSMLFIGPEALAGALGGLGDGLELVSAVLFGVQLWRCEKIARNIPEDKIADLTCLQLAFVTVFSCIALFLEGWSIPGLTSTMASWPAEEWSEIVVMGLVTTAFCLWAEARALREVDAAPAALIYACEPIWGALFAFLWRAEVLDGPLAMGGAFLLLLASAAGALSSAAAPDETAEGAADQAAA